MARRRATALVLVWLFAAVGVGGVALNLDFVDAIRREWNFQSVLILGYELNKTPIK